MTAPPNTFDPRVWLVLPIGGAIPRANLRPCRGCGAELFAYVERVERDPSLPGDPGTVVGSSVQCERCCRLKSTPVFFQRIAGWVEARPLGRLLRRDKRTPWEGEGRAAS